MGLGLGKTNISSSNQKITWLDVFYSKKTPFGKSIAPSHPKSVWILTPKDLYSSSVLAESIHNPLTDLLPTPKNIQPQLFLCPKPTFSSPFELRALD